MAIQHAAKKLVRSALRSKQTLAVAAVASGIAVAASVAHWPHICEATANGLGDATNGMCPTHVVEADASPLALSATLTLWTNFTHSGELACIAGFSPRSNHQVVIVNVLGNLDMAAGLRPTHTTRAIAQAGAQPIALPATLAVWIAPTRTLLAPMPRPLPVPVLGACPKRLP